MILADNAVDPTVWESAMSVPGQVNGAIFCDVTAHYLPGRWRNPVVLRIENGQVIKSEGAAEADCVRRYLERHGAVHFGIGHGADRGEVNSRLRLEGIVDQPTVIADGTVICEDGRFVI